MLYNYTQTKEVLKTLYAVVRYCTLDTDVKFLKNNMKVT